MGSNPIGLKYLLYGYKLREEWTEGDLLLNDPKLMVDLSTSIREVSVRLWLVVIN